MKNTLTINHLNSGSVDLVNRLDTGTNEFLLEVTGGRGATITFDGGNAVSVTSDDFIYSVSSSLWVGSNSLSINISDGTISYTLTIHKIDQLSGDIYIQKDSDTEFTLVKKQDSKRELLDFFYPVGSYYESSDTTFDPNVTWGGTWELEDEGLVHVSSGSNYAVSEDDQDGGSAQITYTPTGTVEGHTLTVNQIPSHNHRAIRKWTSSANPATVAGNPSYGVVMANNDTVSGASYVYTTNTGGGQSHNHGFTGTQATLDNMQPYKVVNRWHRIA